MLPTLIKNKLIFKKSCGCGPLFWGVRFVRFYSASILPVKSTAELSLHNS